MDDPAAPQAPRGLSPARAGEARRHIRTIAQLRRTQSRIDGEIARLTARLAEIAHEQGSAAGGSNGPEYARRSMSAEIAAATNVHPSSARAQMEAAERLVEDFPQTAAALREGRVTQRHARVVLDAGARLDPGAKASLDAHVVPLAQGRTPGELAKIAKIRAARLAPKSPSERHAEARAERGVSVRDLDDGMSEMMLVLPTFHAHAIHDRLTRMAELVAAQRRSARRAFREHADATGGPHISAGEWSALLEQADAACLQAAARRAASTEAADAGRARGGETASGAAGDATAAGRSGRFVGSGDDLAARASDERTFDQLRADLLADILLTSVPTGHELSTAGDGESLAAVRASVQITIPAAMLVDRDRGVAWNGRGAEVAADDALAAAGRAAGWDRLFVSPETGEILAIDRYRPTADQRRRIIARDGTCCYLGCTRPARDCDIDHAHDYARGGETDIGNLEALCETHHVMKHVSGWSVRQTGGGQFEWTSPTGETYPHAPISAVMFRESVADDEPPWAAAGATTTGATTTPVDAPSVGSGAGEPHAVTRGVEPSAVASGPDAPSSAAGAAHPAEPTPGVRESVEDDPRRLAGDALPEACIELSALERLWLSRLELAPRDECRAPVLVDFYR